MEINIKGDPGTGNTFTEVHIGQVQNYVPNATTVINNHYDGLPADSSSTSRHTSPAPSQSESTDTCPIHDEILRYVSRVRPLLVEEHRAGFQQLWTDILALPEVAADIYRPGKQQGTNFNRNLVANILHQLGEHGFFGQYNAAALTEHLEGDKDHSVRAALGQSPVRDIYNKVRARIDEKTNLCS